MLPTFFPLYSFDMSKHVPNFLQENEYILIALSLAIFPLFRKSVRRVLL